MLDLLTQELNSNEKLIWHEIPKQGLMLKASDTFMIPFSLLWGGFAIFWELGVLKAGAPLFFALWGIPFVLVGLYMIFGRFIYDSKLRANTIYGLTEKRAIIISGMFRRKTTSVNLRNLPEIKVTEKTDGSGNITLGATNAMDFFNGSGWPGMGDTSPSFDGIPDVKYVKKLIHEYQNT